MQQLTLKNKTSNVQLQSSFNAVAFKGRVCVCVRVLSAALAPLGQQVAVEDAEQGHGGAVEEQEIEGEQRRRGRRGG